MFPSTSRPVVHPVDVEQPPNPAPQQQPPGVIMVDLRGMPATPSGLGLRVAQFLFAAIALSVMASTNDFMTVTAFCYLVLAAIVQCVWSLSMAIVDIYALLVKRHLRSYWAVRLFAVGDGITVGMTFAAACASAGITSLIDGDLDMCSENHCASFESATAM
ncbi:hypothetical protein ACP70R_013658 [Stipagrostis hirtigluma subsp. patula]